VQSELRRERLHGALRGVEKIAIDAGERGIELDGPAGLDGGGAAGGPHQRKAALRLRNVEAPEVVDENPAGLDGRHG